MRTSLFQRGLAPRLAAAAIYAALAAAAVAWLEPSAQRSGSAAPDAAAATAGTSSAVLCIESVLPVEAWDVRIDGRTIPPGRADAAVWLGEAVIGPDSVLVVDVTPASAGHAANSLRIRVSGTDQARNDVVWCGGHTWSAVVDIAALSRAAAPIDPADLP